ncbi:MAG: sugar-binding domain-containing protein, partial [Chthoniobacteraceae bacterium]
MARADAITGRQVYYLNPDWRFLRADAPDAVQPDFDDSTWDRVSLPHTWNDVDTFDDFGTGGHTGEMKLWTGVAWYRKEFTLPPSNAGKQVFIEFEGVRQLAEVYLNGRRIGGNDTGFIPFGFNLTPYLKFGERNVLTVRADNRFQPYGEGPTPWHHPNWHPPHGGIYRNVRLHVLDPIHVTLPLYADLKTEGIYARTTSLTKEMARVTVSAEIENATAAPASSVITLSLVDRDGRVVGFATQPVTLAGQSRQKVTASVDVADPHLWEPDYPYVYQVRVGIETGGTVRDVATTAFGIRNFRFDTNSGFWTNGHRLKLHGWGQKPTQGWAGLGAALPDWLADFTLNLMDDAGGNMIRWGHSAGSAAANAMDDKYGFVTLMPGVDGERDCEGPAWATRSAAFRDMIIYYRNSPSICVWEGGNYNVSVAHSKELRDIVSQWDPEGRRYFGFRMSSPAQRPYIDLELGTIGRVRAHPYLPVVETEYDRTETPRRVWDKYSPPDFGHLGKNEALNTYHLDSEGFALNAIKEWWTLFGSKPEHSGGANWIFSDGTHGTRQQTDVARATGEVDGVRLPKEAYFALQATWSEVPRVHLIGHWTYPTGTVKAMYAVARAEQVELFVNGRSLGLGERSLDTLFTWKDVAFSPGEIGVVARRSGKVFAEDTRQTAGPAVALKLTPIVAPVGWRADGSDIALVDFEAIDAKGRRCPTDQARVDFELSGPAVWRGGYNSGKEDSINHLWLDTEAGVNRVSLRSRLQAGTVTLTAKRAGLKSATLSLTSAPISLRGGLYSAAPANTMANLGPRPVIDAAALLALTAARNLPTPTA